MEYIPREFWKITLCFGRTYLLKDMFYLKGRMKKRVVGTEKGDCPSASSLLRWAQWPGLGKGEAYSAELHMVSH